MTEPSAGSSQTPPPGTPPPSPPPQPTRPVSPRPPTKALPISGTRKATAMAASVAGAGPLSRRAEVRSEGSARRGFTLPQPPEFQAGVARALDLSLNRPGR